MRRLIPTSAWIAGLVAALAACTPKLEAPGESIRVVGTLEDVAPPTRTPTPAEPITEATPGASGSPTAKGKHGPVKSYPVLHQMPLGVAVYEACSSQLGVFQKCPGTFLGEAKLVKPGPFMVEVDTRATEVVVFGFRGFLGPEQQQEACAEQKVAVSELGKPITLKLEPGTCSIKLERRYG
jgi:hypothetical protein